MRRVFLIIGIVLCCLAAPATALASGSAVIRDCADDSQLQGTYSQQDYQDALNNLPADVDEYTDCRDVIRRAQLQALGVKTGKNGVSTTDPSAPNGLAAIGGAVPSTGAQTPDEEGAVHQAASHGRDPVRVGARIVTPDATGFSAGAVHNDLPTSLLILVILLGSALLTGLGLTVQRYVRRRGQA